MKSVRVTFFCLLAFLLFYFPIFKNGNCAQPSFNADVSEHDTLDVEVSIGSKVIHDIKINEFIISKKIKPLQGVISGPIVPPDSPSPDLTTRLQDIGVTGIRNNDYYDDRLDIEGIFRCPDTSVYPSWECDANDPANYYWTDSDELFQEIIDGGFEPFLRIGGSYQCALRLHDFHGPQNELQENNWIIVAKKIIERYDNWNGESHVLNYVDIYTEWPNKNFWDRSNREFIKFWARAFREIKDTFPHLKVGGPGFLVPTIKVINGQIKDNPAIEFLSYLYEQGLKPDWIGWHLWSNNPEHYIMAARQYRNLLNGKGDFSSVPWAGTGFFDDVEIICDAWGTATQTGVLTGELEKLPWIEQLALKNGPEGAAVMTGTWIALQYSGVKRAFYYRASDPKSNPDASPGDKDHGWSGLFYGDEDATYKPTAYAFKLWSKIYNDFPTLMNAPLPSIAEDGSRLWILGAKGEKGYAVLVSNPESSDNSYKISIDGNSVNSKDYFVTIYQIDEENNGETPSSWSGSSFLIPGYSVQLLIIRPKISLLIP